MKYIVTASALALLALAGPAAADTTCQADAAAKNLHGAALTSFVTKCENDAKTSCEATSKEKKLAGAAHDSFVKKCVGDKVGAAAGK